MPIKKKKSNTFFFFFLNPPCTFQTQCWLKKAGPARKACWCMLTCLQWVRKEAWLSVSMEIRKNMPCFLGIALISKCLKLRRSVASTRTFCSSRGCVFLRLLILWEAERAKESRVNKSFLSFLSTTPAERYHTATRPGAWECCFVTEQSKDKTYPF